VSASLRRRAARAGSVALEFALIGSTFLALLVFVFELGFDLYAQTSLDYAVKQAARQMQTGQQTVANGTTQTSFQTLVFCPFLSSFLSCAGVVVTLQPVSTFQTPVTPPTPPFSNITVNPGGTGKLMLLQAYYNPPIPLWPLNVTTLVGTAAYLNE
jgi:Flp pilus assembly protein TadG